MSSLCGLLGPFQRYIQAIRFYLFTFSVLLCPPLSLAESLIEDISVIEKDGVYHINISALLDADEDSVRSVISDYNHIYRLSDSIIESKVLDNGDGSTRVETQVLCCVPLFCKEVTRVEEVSHLESGDIKTIIIPGMSDFRSGDATWIIKAPRQGKGHGTQLNYNATLEPDFFIPPLLGTRMVIDNMQQEFSTMVYRIQHIARINEQREWDNDFRLSQLKEQHDEPCSAEIAAGLL